MLSTTTTVTTASGHTASNTSFTLTATIAASTIFKTASDGANARTVFTAATVLLLLLMLLLCLLLILLLQVQCDCIDTADISTMLHYCHC